jgi:GNAT superfamily N-acetyltransferase
MKELTVYKEDYCISTSKLKLDLPLIHQFLSTEAYWSLNIPFGKVQQAANQSLTFGVYHQEKQIGYARVISDFTTVAYLGDVFILPEYRGRGLSKWLIETIMHHPSLLELRRWILLTADAHELYRKFGWQEIAAPERWMEIHHKNIYPQ